MHRVRALALTALVTATLLLPAGARSQTAPAVVFEDPSQPARQKELLTRYATTVARWAMVQRVVSAVTAQNEQSRSSERLAELEASWRRGEDPGGQFTALVTNDCAQALQAALTSNPGYADAYVTDQQGALVCASTRASDYYTGDLDSWRQAYAGGAGAIFIGAPREDEGLGSQILQIAVPVRAAGKTVGVMVVSRLLGG